MQLPRLRRTTRLPGNSELVHRSIPFSGGRSCTSLAIVLTLAIASCARSRSDVHADAARGAATGPAISADDMRQRLYAIAHDSMQGRFTGSDGHFKATDYIAREAERLGLRPAGEGGSFFQQVPFVRRHLARAALSVAGRPLVLGQDFVPMHTGGKPRSLDGVSVVFGGNIQDTARMISPEQAAGRFVILVQNANNRAGNINPSAGARFTEAAAIAMVNLPGPMRAWESLLVTSIRPVYAGNEDPQQDRPIALAISSSAAERLLGRSADPNVPPGTAGGVVDGEFAWRLETVPVRNVIAVLPGGHQERASDYVALGAHSDHVMPRSPPVDHDSLRLFNSLVSRMERLSGRRLTNAERASIAVNVDSLRALRPGRPDSIHNGADDDGSGTVALLEIAEALSATRHRPARSLLFVWHAAEEGGLTGSRFFTDNPTIDRNRIVAQLNLDMVGRGGPDDTPGGGPRYLEVIGWRRLSNELGDLIDEVNRRQPVPFSFNLAFDSPEHPEQRYCRSDHYSYARYGIPIAYFSTGQHHDYHQVTDEPQYIDYSKLARVARLVADVAVAAASRERRFALAGPRPDPDEPCRQ